MNHQKFSLFFLLLALSSLPALQVHAQFGPGGFGGGGFGGQGGAGANANRPRRTTRTSPANGAVGDAVISIDPETRSLIVIADDKTRQYISQVVSNLDRPKPQVLIKVVFLEVTHNNSLDVGIEGGISRAIDKSTNNPITGIAANVFGLSSLGSSSTGQVVNVFNQAVQSFG